MYFLKDIIKHVQSQCITYTSGLITVLHVTQIRHSQYLAELYNVPNNPARMYQRKSVVLRFRKLGSIPGRDIPKVVNSCTSRSLLTFAIKR